jgi:serum/glucocorticoid-regulated kinase 2
MGSPSGSSDGDGRSLSQSAADLTTSASSASPSGESNVTENGKRPARTSSGDEPGHRLKKMKKYKEGAEKVLSLFGSPRQEKSQQSQS